jgi:hypothetical protein
MTRISKTKVLRFFVNKENQETKINDNVNIYIPFEVNEIVVDYGVGYDSNIANLQVSSNLFKSNWNGSGIAILNSRHEANSEFYSSNKTRFYNNRPEPINGSYKFSFSDTISGTVYDETEITLLITFKKY